jgi:energy-converting hydrogenase Eha subunit H
LFFAVAGLYQVNCQSFKEQLVSAADAVIHSLLGLVCDAAHTSSMQIIDLYQVC